MISFIAEGIIAGITARGAITSELFANHTLTIRKTRSGLPAKIIFDV